MADEVRWNESKPEVENVTRRTVISRANSASGTTTHSIHQQHDFGASVSSSSSVEMPNGDASVSYDSICRTHDPSRVHPMPLPSLPSMDPSSIRYHTTPSYEFALGPSAHPYTRYQPQQVQQQPLFNHSVQRPMLGSFDHPALLHTGNGYPDSTHTFPGMIGASSFLNTGSSPLLNQSSNLAVTSPFHSSSPFQSNNVFAYNTSPVPSSVSWLKEPLDDNTNNGQHRSHRSKPFPPGDQMIALPSDNISVSGASFATPYTSSSAATRSSRASLKSRGSRAKHLNVTSSSRSGNNAISSASSSFSGASNRTEGAQDSDSDNNGEKDSSLMTRPSDDDAFSTAQSLELDQSAATAAAKSAIQRSFINANIIIRGQRHPVLGLKQIGSILSLDHQPTEHQVKDFNIIPTPVVIINAGNHAVKTCDFVTAHLFCDESMHIEDSIFLTALNAKLVSNNEIAFINLRVTKDMLKGRTKGFSFVIAFTYVSNGHELDTIYTSPFWLFSNVNQEGFPKSERDSYLRPQWRDSTATFVAKRKR